MAQTTAPQSTRWQEIVAIWKDNRWLFVIAGWLLGILTFPFMQQIAGDGLGLLNNLVPEAVGIVFTVLILDRLAENRALHERKLTLFRQLKSRSNDVAVEALDQIRHERWWNDLRNHLQNYRNRINLETVQWGGGVDLTGTNLQDTDLHQANLQQATLRKGNLQGSILEDVNLQNSDLSYTNLRSANLDGANLQGADFYYAKLQGTSLKGANLEQSIMLFATLENSELLYANLQNADLREANLLAVDMTSANLYGANLSHANLHGANLSDANLCNVDFTNTQFNEKTVLPDATLKYSADEMLSGKGFDTNDFYTPDSYWTAHTDMSRYTDPNHANFWQPEYLKPDYQGWKPRWAQNQQ